MNQGVTSIITETAEESRPENVFTAVAGRKYKRTNFIAGYCSGKVLAPFEYDGTSDADLAEVWIETQLLSAAPENTVLFIDNAPFHKKDSLFEIVGQDDSERTLIFLPKYSPDLNKIETALWANLKNFLRNYMKLFDSFANAVEDFFKFK